MCSVESTGMSFNLASMAEAALKINLKKFKKNYFFTFRLADFLEEPLPYSLSFSTEQQMMNSFLWAGPASEASE